MSETRTTTGNDEVTVLLTGAGAPGAWGIIRSLRATERPVHIVGVDMDPDAYGFALVDDGYRVPAGTDEAYVPRIAELAAEADIDVVLPLTTDELQPLAERRGEIPARVMVSDADALSVANDKAALYEFLEERGFDSAPEFVHVDDEASFVEAADALGYPERPICFKPTVGSGMRGFRILDDDADQLTRLLEEKPEEAVTTLEEVRPVLAQADPFPELVVMEYLPGAEYSVDALALGDSVGPVVPRTRAQTRAGITFQGVVEENEQLIEEAGDICRELELEYNVNLQFKYDADGTPKLIEINPRVAGTIVMCVGAGANMPYLGLKHALGEDLPPVDVRWGTWMSRYWDEVFRAPSGETYRIGGEQTPSPKPTQ
ncbi:ATP-grasp domain-containing protein [Haloarcula sp. GH36]|uniref:ATP-grasp domain-containing protein n=1 Tax=Haloarcula montana TaxID=3111776 RepID=UPI002D76B870|nr:ATP-grasp domain-containing protein [Haloarcula sp. GH36]